MNISVVIFGVVPRDLCYRGMKPILLKYMAGLLSTNPQPRIIVYTPAAEFNRNHWSGLYFIFSSSLVLTSSIDVVFILSIGGPGSADMVMLDLKKTLKGRIFNFK